MKARLIEAGKIVNTHGVRGEVKIQPWSNTPDFLSGFKHVYIDGVQIPLLHARVHGGNVLATLGGVTDLDGANALRGKVVSVSRDDVTLPEGEYFIADLVGLLAVDAETGAELGRLKEVLPLPGNSVYVIRGAREILVPAVPDFVKEIDLEAGLIRLRLIEGM